jgi:NADPH:quinone reductase-like Zn-dependent oxidoreductase
LLDCAGTLPRNAHRLLLHQRGCVISTLPGPQAFLLDPMANLVGGIQRRALRLKPDPASLSRLVQWLAEGRLRTIVARIYPLADVRAALGDSRAGQAAGKLLLRVS